ncbi:MAG: penicillin-binding transpeptidase domain-containing protein [bacterium]
MIRKILRKNKIRNRNDFVEPDEIFLDAENLANFNQQQFEGRIEKPIPKRTLWFLGAFFALAAISFAGRLGYLQIHKGEAYFMRSEQNTLEKEIIFADRGIIYDRNRKELVWNKKAESAPDATQEPQEPAAQNDFPIRSYLPDGFAHLLGYVGYPSADKSGRYWQTDFIGKDGLEKQYDEELKGTNGLKIVETDAGGSIQSENIVNAPERGADLVTTIDSRIQHTLYDEIKALSESNLFAGGAGVIMDVTTGEVLTSTSYPEYNSEILSLGKDATAIKGYFEDKRKVFMDKTISGLYTPGSIIKPFMAMGALNENVIDPATKILSTGSISIPNPYDPKQESVFKDWRAQGWVDMRQALAVSSDVYFYEIGGGYQAQKGLGIANIEKYARLFGIGTETGVDLPDENSGTIPSPEWKAQNFKGDPWRVGDTYHTVIGQYGFQVTPMEMARAAASIANYGTLVTPHFILGDTAREKETADCQSAARRLRCRARRHARIRPGRHLGRARRAVRRHRVEDRYRPARRPEEQSELLGHGLLPVRAPEIRLRHHDGSRPSTNGVGAPAVARQLFDWMNIYTPEYFK